MGRDGIGQDHRASVANKASPSWLKVRFYTSLFRFRMTVPFRKQQAKRSKQQQATTSNNQFYSGGSDSEEILVGDIYLGCTVRSVRTVNVVRAPQKNAEDQTG